MAFSGFTAEAFAFYAGLEAENTREYWTAHKAVYEEHVREPFRAFTAELEDEFGPVKLFRPNRDVRFAADKSPYKTQQGAATEQGFYVHLDADGIFVAGGMHVMAPDQVRRYRAAVDEDLTGGELEHIVAALPGAGLEVGGDRLKTRPRGTAPDHPRLDLLRYRSLYAHTGWPTDPWMHTSGAVTRVREAWRAIRPLADWENRNVGPTENPR